MKEQNEKKPIKNDPDYKAAYAPDASMLSELLEIAKGPDRTMAEFVKVCKGKKNLPSVSEPTFSRIRRQAVNRPVSDDLLRIIAEHSANPEEANYKTLMRANGKVPVEEYQETLVRLDNRNTYKLEQEIKENIKMIILNALFEEGHSVMVYPSLRMNNLMPKTEIGGAIGSDFALHVQGFDPKYWNFILADITFYKVYSPSYIREIHDRIFQNNVKSSYSKDGAQEKSRNTFDADEFLRQNFEFFLRDAWEAENFGKDYKNTFVFADEGPFKAVETMLIKAKINTWVSLLLVDIEKKKVVKESIIRNETGSNKSDFFQNKCFGNRKGRI